jgi:hypothetical protein
MGATNFFITCIDKTLITSYYRSRLSSYNNGMKYNSYAIVYWGKMEEIKNVASL